jgi:hypothetical protein
MMQKTVYRNKGIMAGYIILSCNVKDCMSMCLENVGRKKRPRILPDAVIVEIRNYKSCIQKPATATALHICKVNSNKRKH